jgi:nucleoid-associated protein YgaU
MKGRLIFAIWLTSVFAACDKGDSQREGLEAGDRRVKVGAYREAIRSYEGVLDGTAKTADIHYKIAVLYDDKLKEPLDAIHHYGRYLELSPNGSHAKEAKAGQSDCEKRLQAKMTKEGFMTTTEAVRLRSENESLRKLITDLRNPKPPPPPRSADPTKADALPPGAQQHTVARGETLASIAQKYYHNRNAAGNIKDANFNQLGGKDVIKPGQVLIIPEAPKRKR